MHGVIRAQVGLMEHPGIDLAAEQILEQDVGLLAEYLVVCEIPSPVAVVQVVVLVRPFGRRCDVVEEVDRSPRDHEDARVFPVEDAGLGRRVVHPGPRGVRDEEADAGVVGRSHGLRVREPGDVGRDQRTKIVVRESHGGGYFVVARDLLVDDVVAGGVQVLVAVRVIDPWELEPRHLRRRGERVEGVGAGRAFPVHVVVDEDIVDLGRHVDVALSQEQPPGHPVHDAVREHQAVDQEEVPIERHGEHLATVGIGPDQGEGVALGVAQEHVRSGSCRCGQVRPGLGDDDRIRRVHVGKHGLPCRRQLRGDRARRGVQARRRAEAQVRGRIHICDRGADPILGLVVPQGLPFRRVEGAGPGRAVEVRQGPGGEHDALVERVSAPVRQHARRESAGSLARDVERVGNAFVLHRLTDRSKHRLGPVGGDDQDLRVQSRRRDRQLGRARRGGRVRGKDLGQRGNRRQLRWRQAQVRRRDRQWQRGHWERGRRWKGHRRRWERRKR